MSKSINIKQKIALIGCGYWGTIIINALNDIGFKDIVIFDKNKKNSLILKKKFKNLLIADSYEKLLDKKDIKSLFFATPPSSNFTIVKKAIRKNKNIFLEKPGFVSVNEFSKIISLTKKSQNILMFGYVYCYNDYIKYIKKIISSKKLGKLLYIKFQRQNLGPIRNDINSNYDLASHDLSIILKFFGKLPSIIKNISYPILNKKNADISSLHMKFEDTYIDINTSWLNPIKVRRITIIGAKKMLLFDELNLKSPIKIYNKYAKYPDVSQFDKKFFKSKAKIYLGNSKSIKIISKSPLKNEIEHFFKCANKKKNPITNKKFAFKILKFLNRVN